MSFDESSEARFAAYVEALTSAIGHADRATPLRHYCTGLLMPAARKSVEPMAAMTAPARAAAQHQSLLHFDGQAPWSDAAVLINVRDLVLPAIERAGPIEAWIIDDTGFPKKGRHSVGRLRVIVHLSCQIPGSLSVLTSCKALKFFGRRAITSRTPICTVSVASAATGTCQGAEGMICWAGSTPWRISR